MKAKPVYLSDWLYQQASKLAEENGMTFSGLVRYLLIHALAEKEPNLTVKKEVKEDGSSK